MRTAKHLNVRCMVFVFTLILFFAFACEREGTQEAERTDEGEPSQGAWTIDERSDDDNDEGQTPGDYGADIGSGSMDPANPISIGCNPDNLDAVELALADTVGLIDLHTGHEIETGDDNPMESMLAACAGSLLSRALACAASHQDNSELVFCLENARDTAVHCGYEPADVFDSRSLAVDIQKMRTRPQSLACLKAIQAESTCADFNCLMRMKNKIEDCLIR